MEEAAENGKELLHSANANGMNEYFRNYFVTINTVQINLRTFSSCELYEMSLLKFSDSPLALNH